MAFWTDPGDPYRPFAEPKRPYRFMVRIGGFQGGSLNATRASGLPEYLWYAISCDKPAYNIEMSEHRLNNRVYKFPKGVTWEDITITLVDTDCPSLAEILGRYLEDAGGPGAFWEGGSIARIIEESAAQHPVNQKEINTTITKMSAIWSLEGVQIYQLDAEGRILEEWHLWNAIIKNVNWGKLDYGDDGFMNVTLTLAYDWATVATSRVNIESASNAGARMSFWTETDIGNVTEGSLAARQPSRLHYPITRQDGSDIALGRGYKATDANADGRPDILENYIDSFTESAVVEEESGEGTP